ncbi:hypothetical protein KR054_011101 [Drosophila jambulina]|nr:hypothetical protein KR054_011101 [Drosophila jambulina]
MLVNCEFNLSRAAAIYYCGERILGSLTVTVGGKKPFPLEGVNITLYGASSVHWRETDPGPPQIEHNDSTRQVVCTKLDYKGGKVHINETKNLMGGQILQPGSKDLGSFVFQLPESLPATCSVPYGRVEYILRVVMERRSKHSKCFEQRLVVRRSLEFTDLKPQFKDTSMLSLSLPRSVFVPGQNVDYKVESRDGILEILTRLCQSISYQSSVPEKITKTVTKVLAESSASNGNLRLPLTAPIMSHPDQFGPIHISYYIEAYNFVDPPVRLPLFVATVAPPTHSACIESSRLCFVNLALSHGDWFAPINQLLAQSCSREIGALALNKHCERIRLLKGPKRKQSYVQLALQYFHKKVLP